MATFRVKFNPTAQRDLREITRWYDDQSTEAGDRFFDAVRLAVDKLQADPERYARLEKRPAYRKMKMAKYPYSVYFKTYPASLEVLIVSIFHEKRNPQTLLRRLK